MTNAPHLLPGSRAGHVYGTRRTARPRRRTTGSPTPSTTSRWAPRPSASTPATASSRTEQDEIAAASHVRAGAAQAAGVFDDEIVAVEIPQRKGDPVVVDDRRGRAPRLARSRCSRSCVRRSPRSGTITAGNSSPLSDGAAAVVVASREWAESQRPAVARPRRRLRPGRRPRQLAALPAVERDRRGPRARAAARHPTSTSSRSTRRSPRSRCSRPRELGLSTATSSTCTAARSRSATRSAPRAPASRCTRRSSSRDAAAARAAVALCGGGGQGEALLLSR